MDLKVGDEVTWDGSGDPCHPRPYRGVIRELCDGYARIEDNEWHAISGVSFRKLTKVQKLTAPHCLGYVSIHSAEEHAKFVTAMSLAGIQWSSDYGQVPERKWRCQECGAEVREHTENGDCP